MTREDIHNAYEVLTPTPDEKERILNAIPLTMSQHIQNGKTPTKQST